MSGIDNSYKIDGDVLLVIHASIPPGVHRPTDRPTDRLEHSDRTTEQLEHSTECTAAATVAAAPSRTMSAAGGGKATATTATEPAAGITLAVEKNRRDIYASHCTFFLLPLTPKATFCWLVNEKFINLHPHRQLQLQPPNVGMAKLNFMNY